MKRVETGNGRDVEPQWAGDSDWPAEWPDGLDARATGPANAPASVQSVWASLRSSAKPTTSELQQRSGLPARTVRHALRWLEAKGLATRVAALGDARRNRVILRQDVAVGGTA